jgi:N-acetylglucosamine kinase-like BadF-type ATPase
MILIADSGSTKTDWRLISPEGNISQFGTEGFNPYFVSSEYIRERMSENLLNGGGLDRNAVNEIFFYGAGCGAADKKKVVADALAGLFEKARIHIETDLLGAARALCGRSPGMAAILGTGASTCLYDGESITESRPSLGYILGDEGSGAHIGKMLVQAVLYNNLPERICERFLKRFELDRASILDKVYRQPLPNRFLASFSKFAYQNLKDPAVHDLVVKCFDEFFINQICRYPDYKSLQLSCTGSVAFYYSNIFRAVALKHGVNIRSITEAPIAGLTLYHLGEE